MGGAHAPRTRVGGGSGGSAGFYFRYAPPPSWELGGGGTGTAPPPPLGAGGQGGAWDPHACFAWTQPQPLVRGEPGAGGTPGAAPRQPRPGSASCREVPAPAPRAAARGAIAAITAITAAIAAISEAIAVIQATGTAPSTLPRIRTGRSCMLRAVASPPSSDPGPSVYF